MDSFLLVAWIFVGEGHLEQMRKPHLSGAECRLQAMRIEEDAPGQVAMCISEWIAEPAWTPYKGPGEPVKVCPRCWWPLPGRLRV